MWYGVVLGAAYLQQAITVRVGVLSGQAGKVGLVVMAEVKVVQLGVAHQHALVILGHRLEWVVACNTVNHFCK